MEDPDDMQGNVGFDRRDFLRVGGSGAMALSMPFPGIFFNGTAPGKTNPLVVIYLRGGQDALNTIVPYGDPRYFEIRPTIAVPKKDGANGKGVIPLDKTFGLHPSLEALKPLFDRKLFAPILNVGSPHPTRSHFDAQDFMEYAAPGLRNVRSGWLNRYLRQTSEEDGGDPVLRAIAMQGLLPRSVRGELPVLAVPQSKGRRRGRPGEREDELLDLFDRLYKKPPAKSGAKNTKMKSVSQRDSDRVVEAGQATIRALRRYREVMNKPVKQTQGATYPAGRLGDKLKNIAHMIKSGEPVQIACADYNGWDHHANEGHTDGTISRMLEHLGRSLAAFVTDLGDDVERCLVLTMTEFGRTCRENGNRGTDHGHGGLMLAVGGRVNGGQIHGKWNGLEDKHLYMGRDLPATTDFRDVMNEVLRKQLDFKAPRDFFPGYRPGKRIGFLR
jgi:uncharacterized protein (DUF1501 family)